jgi:SAM-dependent methyltransferase
MQRSVSRLVVLLLLACAILFWWKKQIDKRNAAFDSADAEETWNSGNAPKAAAPSAAKDPVLYELVTASADGIGKRFMGREIAKVMGHPAIGWLEREEREREEAPSKALLALQLQPTDVIADIGAGSGYYAFRMTNLVPQGSVVAVDIQQEMLDFVTEQAASKGVKNLRTHLGKFDDVALPEASIDAALMVDAYHEFSHPAEMLRSLHRALKADGRIYLLEFRAEDPRVPIKPLHKMTEAQAVAEFSALGFRLLSNRSHLPWQHFMVFGKAQ